MFKIKITSDNMKWLSLDKEKRKIIPFSPLENSTLWH